MMKVLLNELREKVDMALQYYGYSDSERTSLSQVLLFAQLRGNNQWIVKLVWKGIPRAEDEWAIELEKDSPASALINGNYNHAMAVLDYATDVAIQKAQKNGIAIVGNYRAKESTGALGYYVEKIAKNNLIGIAMATAAFPVVAPYWSTQWQFCTNPVAYGIPVGKDPVVLDFATSEMAYYGLIEADIEWRALDHDAWYDNAGVPTKTPSKIMNDGSLKACAGQKWSGLSLVVQLLAGPLIQAWYPGHDEKSAGNLIIAFDPELFGDLGDFTKHAQKIIDNVHNSKKAPWFEEVLIPGERGYRHYNKAISEDALEIEDNLRTKLCEVADLAS